jgi:hypothetical protein
MDDTTVMQAAELLGIDPIRLPDGGYLLYVPADPTKRRAHVGRTSIDAPPMTAAEFTGWMEDGTMDAVAAAARLSALTGCVYLPAQVYQFRNGKRPVPARVRLAIAQPTARAAETVARIFAT